MQVWNLLHAARFSLHFAWVVDDAKCILVTRVCLCVCLSVCLSVHRIPTLLHRPGCKLGEWWGCPLVVHYRADLQPVHGFRCYDNIAQTRNVSECLYSPYAWFLYCTCIWQLNIKRMFNVVLCLMLCNMLCYAMLSNVYKFISVFLRFLL